jgi:hypothetical protein
LAALAVLLLAGGAALAAMVNRSGSEPHGQWDAWAMWNLKAKLIHGGGDGWAQLLRDGSPHADYPLLQPLAIARLWHYAGAETVWGPPLFAATCLLMMIAVTTSVVTRLRGLALGASAGLAVLACPMLLREAASQYADLALALFITCAVGLLALALAQPCQSGRIALLAGLAAGAAAWTKNEGILFAAALLLAAAGVGTCTLGARRALALVAALALGLAPFAGAIFWCKLAVSGHSDLLAAPAWGQLVGDGERHQRIGRIALFLLRNGPNHTVVAAAIGLILLLPPALNRGAAATVGIIGVTLILQLAGYYAVLLITPRDIAWHLATTADRLFIHLWPPLVVLLFVTAGAGRGAGGGGRVAGPGGGERSAGRVER